MRQSNRRPHREILLALWLLVAAQVPSVHARDYEDRRDPDGYVFATTRGLNEMDAHPAFKLSILPVVVVLDLVFLPFALVADAMSGNL